MTPSEHLDTTTASLLEGSHGVKLARDEPQRVGIRQNWVLDPVQDTLFIIAAPLISLGLALLVMHQYGAERGAALVILAHVVLTVAHHLPTFIRIYGDVDLFRRFKWSFVLGPVVPLTFCVAVLSYINYHRYPVEYFLYLYIFLALWDPWHFLRQHFGLMRIYDRHNAAPARLASNMDWAICTVWFVHIMAASTDWIPGLLEDLYRNARLPLLLMLSAGWFDKLRMTTSVAALLMTAVYAGYLLWCVRRHYYVSPAKIALLLCTFGVMYLTYTPNDVILQWVPAWGFKVGFATVGIVHMTQYLAIVWRYDQRIAQQGRARAGWFGWLHARRSRMGVLLGAGIYVLLCIVYGDVITTSHANRWLASALLAVGFVSTAMHYYFDGFIWKVRHQQNREALNMQPEGQHQARPAPAISWWSSAGTMTAGRMLMRQLLYFGLPMGILTVGAVSVWGMNSTSYVQHMYAAQRLSQQGSTTQAEDQARLAYAGMRADLPFVSKLAELRPSSAHEAELAFLIYNESLYENLVMPQLAGVHPGAGQIAQHRRNVARAGNILMSAVYRGGQVAHTGREQLTREQAEDIAMSWQAQQHQ